MLENLLTVLEPDLLHALEIWTESAVTAENLLVDDGGDRQAVEAIRECLPQLDVEAPFTCGESPRC